MIWTVEYIQQAQDDLDRLDNAIRLQVLRAIMKVAQNPLPSSDGGYGKPLGNHNGTNLAGYLKIKLLAAGIRIVYRLITENGCMRIIVISARDDNAVYKIAHARIYK